MRALVSIGSYDLPEPSTYSGTIATIVDSARNAKGVTVGAVIREDVAKVELTWNFIKPEDWATMLQKFSSNYSGHFYNDVTFFCDLTNSWITRKMYVSDRTNGGVFLRNPDGSIKGYTGARIALIEV